MTSSHIAMNTAVVRDNRTTADMAAEYEARSASINAIHPYYHGKVEPREPSQEERDAVQRRIDSYQSHAFAKVEAAEYDHWSY